MRYQHEDDVIPQMSVLNMSPYNTRFEIVATHMSADILFEVLISAIVIIGPIYIYLSLHHVPENVGSTNKFSPCISILRNPNNPNNYNHTWN